MRMSISPQNGGFHRWTGAPPGLSPLGICASRSPALPGSLISISSRTHANQAASILLQRRTDQVFRLCVVERQKTATIANARGINQVAGVGFDQHQLDHSAITPEPVQGFFVLPLLDRADAVVGTGEAGIQ